LIAEVDCELVLCEVIRRQHTLGCTAIAREAVGRVVEKHYKLWCQKNKPRMWPWSVTLQDAPQAARSVGSVGSVPEGQ
jgi:hypothetical protein